MKKTKLGELEELVLLTVASLQEEAYGVEIKRELEARLNEKLSVGSIQSALKRMEEKGFLTSEFGETELIQNRLEELLKEVILPNTDYKIAHRWSGIMGLGSSKRPIVEQLSEHVYCGVRLGGLGVAIGSLIGQELADLV